MTDKTETIVTRWDAIASGTEKQNEQQQEVLGLAAPRAHEPHEIVSVLKSEQQISRIQEPQRQSQGELIARRIIFPEMRDRQVCNSFRDLRTSLFRNIGIKNFVLMVTAAAGQSGSSFVARNLAAAVAFDRGRTALLIDCNPRNPSVDDLIPKGGALPGLTDYLCGTESHIESIIYRTGIPRLRVIPVGLNRELGQEHFISPQLHTLLEHVRERYPERSIIVDAPPLTEADARILAELCDYLLLVVRYGHSTKTQITSAISSLDPNRVVGTVFNDVPELWNTM